MVQWLNRSVFLLVTLLGTGTLLSQPMTGGHTEKDYKDRKSHENFRKRRITVAAWQINNLKRGALVVRLPSSHLLINELKKRGEDEQAEIKRVELAAANLNMMHAFRDNFRFCKVYYIYSNSSDSLLQGARSGIFVDSTLKINPGIKMTESFYLLAESDFAYNSSIGFVREDSAQYVTEHGTPSTMEMPVVVKNKYGHQLKEPFPYTTSKFAFTKNVATTEIPIGGKTIVFDVINGSGGSKSSKTESGYIYNGKQLPLSIQKMKTYDVLCRFVDELNRELEKYYRNNSGFSNNSKNYEDSKPFFY